MRVSGQRVVVETSYLRDRGIKSFVATPRLPPVWLRTPKGCSTLKPAGWAIPASRPKRLYTQCQSWAGVRRQRTFQTCMAARSASLNLRTHTSTLSGRSPHESRPSTRRPGQVPQDFCPSLAVRWFSINRRASHRPSRGIARYYGFQVPRFDCFQRPAWWIEEIPIPHGFRAQGDRLADVGSGCAGWVAPSTSRCSELVSPMLSDLPSQPGQKWLSAAAASSSRILVLSSEFAGPTSHLRTGRL